MAQTLFSLYLTAMLKVALNIVEEGVNIPTEHNAVLFNVSHLETKTKAVVYLYRKCSLLKIVPP